VSRPLILERFNFALLMSAGLSCLACADEIPDGVASGTTQLRSLDDGLELHWTFEDHDGNQITDLSGNGRHGTLNGGSLVSSPLGEAVSLDGVDDHVSLTHLGLRDPALYGGVDGDFTISARVRVDDVDKLNTLCFGCGPFSSMFIGTVASGPKVQSAVFNQQTGGLLWPTSSPALVADEWREVTMVVDGGVVASYYLDCELDTQLQDPNIGLKNHNFSSVGQGATAERWYGGEIDRLRVWSRALSEQELVQLCPLGEGLELDWTFEDHVDNVITDASGNGRHGTLNGGSFVSSPEGEAVSLDGVDDYIALTHLGLRDPSLYGGVDGDFTISAQVRVDDVGKLNTLCYGCGPFATMFIGTAVSGPKVQSAVFNQQTSGTLWPISSDALVDDQWREVTMVVDGGVVASYYLDCVPDTQLLNPDIGLKNYNFSAVGQGSNADRWYGGEIDRLRVWSRAMSEQELALLCPAAPADEGPELHWTFEDRDANLITDVSGNGRHGTLNGGSFVSSPNGDAVALDGVDDYISIAHLGLRDPSLYGGVDGDFTISTRVRVADANKLNSLCYGCGPFASMFVGTTVSGPKVQSAVFNQQTGGSLWPISSAALVADEWREVTMVVDGGVVASYYVDCELDTQLEDPNIGLKNYNFSAVGQGSSADRWYGGEIDELRIWNRALSQQELDGLCGDLEQGIVLMHVESDVDEGLWWMDLSDPNPLSTATELFSGPWYPSTGRSDGHYVFARSYAHPYVTEYDGALLDISVTPPLPIDPGLPVGQHVRDGEVTPDGSALIIRSFDEDLFHDWLWRVPIDELGQLGVPELLTPDVDQFFTSSFPVSSVFSADNTILATPIWSRRFFMGSPDGLAIVDLVNGGILHAVGAGDENSPRKVHLTPDGGELAWEGGVSLMPQDGTWWSNVDSEGPAVPLSEIGVLTQTFGDWASDDRTALWGSAFDYYDGLEDAFVLTFGEDDVTSQQIATNFNVRAMYFHEGGEWVLLGSDDDATIFAAPVDDGMPGVVAPILGEQLGEGAVLAFLPDASRGHAVVFWEREDLTRDCSFVNLVDGAVVWTWDIGTCTSAAAPMIVDDHAYFIVTDVNIGRTIRHLDIGDPLAVAEPISAPDPWSIIEISPSGEWVIQWEGASYSLTGLSQPGVSTLLEFDGMIANMPPRIVH
jgi:hypothetical protein